MLQNLGFAFSSSKLKANLKMANTRMQLAINKKTNAIKVSKREIASMLKEGKEEKARIRVEPVIRDDFTIEAYEILSLICELLVERMRIIESQSECPADLVEGLSTLIYAADRIDVAELVEVKKQIKLKYGKDFIANAEMNTGGCCNERVVHKLSLQPPSAYLCINYLQEIAHNHNVDWAPPEDMPADPAAVAAGSFGYSVPNAPGSEFFHIQDEEKLDPPMATAAPMNDKAPRTGLSGLLPTRKKNNRDDDHGPGNVPSEGLMPNTRAYPGPIPSTLPAQGAVPSAPPEPTDSGHAFSRANVLPRPDAYSPPPYVPATNQADTSLPEAIPIAPGADQDETKSDSGNNLEDSYADIQARFNALQKLSSGDS